MCLITPFHGPGNTKIPDFIEEIRDYGAGLKELSTQAKALTAIREISCRSTVCR